MTETTARPPAIIWDMGGILYRYFTEVLLSEADVRDWDLSGLPMGPTGPLPDPDYAAMDRGEIEEPTYVQVIRDRFTSVGLQVDPVTAIDWTDEFREPVWEAIRTLHRHGHPQAVLTNDAARWLGDGWWITWEPASWFDVMLDVSTLEFRKPAAGAYLAVTERLGRPPRDCLFVDDLRVNCKGAEDVGMASVWFDITDPDGSVMRVLEAAGAGASTG